MTEEKTKPGWVWWSDGSALEDYPQDQRPVSVLAVVETIVASGVGIWLWLTWGLYPLMLTSAVMAFLTMLRCDASVDRGARWFANFVNPHDYPLKSWRGAGGVLLSGLVAFLVTWWIAGIWLSPHEGWAEIWRGAVLGLLAVNIGLAVAVASTVPATVAAAAAAVAAAAAIVVAAAVVGAAAATVAGAAAVAGAGGGAALILALSGFALGIFLRAFFIRVAATLYHLLQGIMNFGTNWAQLVTTVDLWTEPELVPDLPENSIFRLKNRFSRMKTGDISDKMFNAVVIPIFFLPAYLFRLTLKSTFLFYWPLLFISSAPGTMKAEDGTLIWDDARGRRVLDWGAFLLAVGALVGILYGVYDPDLFDGFVEWADPRGLPAHELLRVVGFQVWQLDLWEWCALGASAVTVIVFLWANAINTRHGKAGSQPGYLTLKVIYALNRLKTLLVTATILASLIGMLWFVHDSCSLPQGMTNALTYLLGPPQACVGQ